MNRIRALGLWTLFLVSCNGSVSGGNPGAGAGPTSTGGASAGVGGSTATTATGGAAMGGAAVAGGTGGMNTSGGPTGSGGAHATGGASASGGTRGTGGISATGGTTATGGTSSAGTGGTTSTGGLPPMPQFLVPAQGLLFGAFVGSGTVAQLETTLGRKLAIIQNYFGWTDNWVARVPGDLSGGRIPLITWIPNDTAGDVTLDDIINGVHDTMINTRATAAKNVAGKFFLRWGHEMNGNWSNYDGFHNGANAAATAKFVSAYRHIHDLFVSAGATNVLWVFCPNVNSVPNDAWNQWINYYPGDSYVDWMSFDGYNFAGSTQTWVSFSAIVGGIYSGLAAKNKPIMIAETSSSEIGGDKAAWIAGVVPALKGSYPNIKALVWFHVTGAPDWRLDSTTAAGIASTTMAKDPYFNP